jgi:hypothetical protein
LAYRKLSMYLGRIYIIINIIKVSLPYSSGAKII